MTKIRIPRKKKKIGYISRMHSALCYPNMQKLERYLRYIIVEHSMREYKLSEEGLYSRYGFVTKDDVIWWHWVRKKHLGIEPQMSEEFREYWDYFVSKGVIK